MVNPREDAERSSSFDGLRKRTCGNIAKKQLKKAKGQIEKANKKIKGQFVKANNKIKEAASKTKSRVKDEVKKIHSKVLPHIRQAVTGSKQTRIRDHMKKTPVVKFVDKLSFFFGVNLLVFCEFVLLKQPHLLWLLFLAVCPALIFIRAPMYFKNKWQFFILDYCYFVNFSYVICIFCHVLDLTRARYLLDALGLGEFHIWNATFLRLNFAMSTGPLICAIWVWRNSAVFHSLDKMTSWYIHWLPAVLAFCQRWHTNFISPSALPSILDLNLLSDASSINFVMCRDAHTEDALDTSSPGGNADSSRDWSGLPECGHASVAEWFVYPMAAYIGWQLFYLLATEVVMGAQIRADKNIQTSVRWLTADTKSGINKFCTFFSKALGILGPDEKWDGNSAKTKIVFVTFQLFYTMLTFLPVKLCYEYYWVHVFFLLATFFRVIWNGAAFYIEVFAVRYMRKFPASPPGSPQLKPIDSKNAPATPPPLNGVPVPGDGTY